MKTRFTLYLAVFSLSLLAHAAKPPPSPKPVPVPPPVPLEKILTTAQIQELKTDRAAVDKANPGFLAQEKVINEQIQADRKAKQPVSAGLTAQQAQHEVTVQEAILSYDPKAAPLLAKIKAAHRQQR